MRFDDLTKRPARPQRPLTYTESLQAKLNAQLATKPTPKFTALEWSIMEGGGSLPEPVTELFDPKSAAPLEWEKSPGVTYAAGNVRIGDKDVAIDVTFSDEGNGKVEVEFMVGGEFKITGGGGAQQVFATVIEALKKFVTENPKVQYLIFSADEYSRAKLYHMMALRAKEIGFHAVPEDQIEKGVLPRSSSFGGFPFVLKRGISDAPKQRPQPFNPVFYVHDMEHPEIDPVPIKAKSSSEAEKIGQTLPQFKDSDPFAIFASKTNPRLK